MTELIELIAVGVGWAGRSIAPHGLEYLEAFRQFTGSSLFPIELGEKGEENRNRLIRFGYSECSASHRVEQYKGCRTRQSRVCYPGSRLGAACAGFALAAYLPQHRERGARKE